MERREVLPLADSAMPVVSSRDLRAAQLANVLASGVREKRLEAVDALRVLRHELRRRNTNKKLLIERRSVAAQAVIDRHAELGTAVPNNNSLDALHADHVHALTVGDLHDCTTVEQWLVMLQRLREVVCVTAEENYRLEVIEKAGVTGEAKYLQAKIAWT